MKTLSLICLLVCGLRAEELPLVTAVEFQPLAAQAGRVIQALEVIGEPLPVADVAALRKLIATPNGGKAQVEAMQKILDRHALAGIEINPESRVKVQQGQAPARLMEQGWRAFLVKVANQAGITAVLAVESPNAGQLANTSAGQVGRRWIDHAMFNKQPMKPHLSGLELEYRILQLYSKDAGKREAKLIFDVGQGTQDLGFRSEVDILFTAVPAAKIVFRVKDVDGKTTTAGFTIRDEMRRVYPPQTKRLNGDFFFHPQVYRADGEHVMLPPGSYTIDYGWDRSIEPECGSWRSPAPKRGRFRFNSSAGSTRRRWAGFRAITTYTPPAARTTSGPRRASIRKTCSGMCRARI